MIPDFEPLVPVKRSASFKLNIGNYQSIDFWAYHEDQCPRSQRAQLSKALHAQCLREVLEAAQEYRDGLEPAVEYPTYERGNASDSAFQERARQNTVEQNPFQVGEKPKDGIVSGTMEPPTSHFSPSNEEPKQEVEPPLSSTGEPQVVEPPKPAEAKRRGRPPGQQKAAESYAPPIENKQPTPIDGKFKANDDDLPTVLGGTHTPEPLDPPRALAALKQTVEEKPKTQMERLDAVVARLSTEHKRAPGDTKDQVRQFVKSFLQRNDVPKPDVDSTYNEVLPILESLAAHYGGKLVSQPEGLGTECREGWKDLKDGVASLSSERKDLAIKAATRHYPDHPSDILEFLKCAEMESDVDAIPFLQVFLISKDGLAKLRELSAASKQPIGAIVKGWGLDLAKATEGDVVKAIMAGAKPQGEATLWG